MKRGDFSGYTAAREKADRAALKTGEVSEFLSLSKAELKEKTYGPAKNKSIAEHQIEAIAAISARKKQEAEQHREMLANRALTIAEAHGTMPERLKAVYGDDSFGPVAYSVGGSSPERLTNRTTEARDMYDVAAQSLLKNSHPLFDQKIRDDETHAEYEINWESVSSELRSAYTERHKNADRNNVMYNSSLYINNAYAYTVKMLQSNVDKNPTILRQC